MSLIKPNPLNTNFHYIYDKFGTIFRLEAILIIIMLNVTTSHSNQTVARHNQIHIY